MWPYGLGPPVPPNYGTPTFIYPPPYPPAPPAPPPPEVKKQVAEWKQFEAYRRAIDKSKDKKKEEKKEKKGIEKITGAEYSFAHVLLWLLLVGPFVAPSYNKIEAVLLKLINGN